MVCQETNSNISSIVMNFETERLYCKNLHQIRLLQAEVRKIIIWSSTCESWVAGTRSRVETGLARHGGVDLRGFAAAREWGGAGPCLQPRSRLQSRQPWTVPCRGALGSGTFTASTARRVPFVPFVPYLRGCGPGPARPRRRAVVLATGPAVIDGSDKQSAPSSADPPPRRHRAGARQTWTTRPSMPRARDAPPAALWGAGHGGVCRRQAAAVPCAARPPAHPSPSPRCVPGSAEADSVWDWSDSMRFANMKICNLYLLWFGCIKII